MHDPVPSTQLLSTCEAAVQLELHTAVKLPPVDIYVGRHWSVQPPPFVVYDVLQFDVFVCPVGNVGSPPHAEEKAYKIIPSIWPKRAAVLHVPASI